MEFREYWQVIWKRRHLVVPLVAITFVASALFNLVLPPTYKTDTTVYVQAILPPPLATSPYYSEPYYRTVHSEYLTDDLGMYVKSWVFADLIAGQIKSRYGQSVEVKDVLDSVASTKKLHRTVKITIATGNEQLTKRISEAMHDLLQTEATRFLMREDRQDVQIKVIDPPRKPTSPGILRRLLDVLLHSAVALIVGTGLAFLLHALDDRVQDEEDAFRTAGWPVLGAIPAEGAAGVALGGTTTASGLASRAGRLLRPLQPATRRAVREPVARRRRQRGWRRP